MCPSATSWRRLGSATTGRSETLEGSLVDVRLARASWVRVDSLTGQTVAHQADVDLQRVEHLREAQRHAQLVSVSLQGVEARDQLVTRRAGTASQKGR